jgi:hypothetical protein
MRAPGEGIGMLAFEQAMDELAYKTGLDPIELRIRNEPKAHPESGKAFSTRQLVGCYREGARRLGWERPAAATGHAAPWSVAERLRHVGGDPKQSRIAVVRPHSLIAGRKGAGSDRNDQHRHRHLYDPSALK